MQLPSHLSSHPTILVVGRTLGVSPLVAVAQTARAHLPSRLNQEARLPPPPPTTTASVPGSAQVNPDPLTTPVAPRTLARAINADYRPHVSVLCL